MSKAKRSVGDIATDQLFVLAASLHELAARKRARAWGVSAQTAAIIINPSKPLPMGNVAAWSKLPKKLRNKFKYSASPHRARPAKTKERCFNLPPTPIPDWYLDASLPLPSRLIEILHR